MSAIRGLGMALVVSLVLSPVPAEAWSYGLAGTTLRDTGAGCASCHGATPGGVSALLEGPLIVLPGETFRYEVIVSDIGNPLARAGFTTAVTKMPGQQPVFSNVAGQATAVTDGATQIVNNDAGGTMPLPLPVNGSASFFIDLTIPTTVAIGNQFTLFTVVAAGARTLNVGWDHAANLVLTVGAPTPLALNADQGSAGFDRIALDWIGADQGEHFRLLGKTGDYPSSPTDPDAFLVYEGPANQAEATGLNAGAAYYFAVWGKVPDQPIYSSGAALAVASTQAAEIFQDRFEISD